MHDYKHYRFPRTQREAGWHTRGEWDDKSNGSGWASALFWGVVGTVMLWLFLTLVLGVA
jgi:hypothetical protein